jgi:hypothetical protein
MSYGQFCALEPFQSPEKRYSTGGLEECCATGVYLDLEANDNTLHISACTVATCHLDLEKRDPVTLEFYCHSSTACGNEGDEEGWRLVGVQKVAQHLHISTTHTDVPEKMRQMCQLLD